MAVFVVGCRFVDELWRVCRGLPIWVLGSDGGVLWMSCSGFMDWFVLLSVGNVKPTFSHNR
jgi:hypothetical protein